MIPTIDTYEDLQRCDERSKKFSSHGRAVTVYWNPEAENFIVTKKGSRAIFCEFLTGQEISKERLQRLWNADENGRGLGQGNNMKNEMTLQDIALKANKDKAQSERREVFEYAGSEDYDYRIAGKHSISMGAGHKVR